jgi:glutamate synthase domain-containing protein 2
MRELAMALRWASDAKLDLVTIDGAPGGTGMSPWPMMEEWGIPTFYLQCMTQQLCDRLAAKGAFVPDVAIGGGLSTEDHIFKVLAMGSPYTKALCMGRALMIPGMVGKNIALWLEEGPQALPKTVSEFGAHVEEIFITYEHLVAKYGREEVKKMPLGAVAMFTFIDKMRVGLQQFMAGSRNFRISTLSRSDLTALTEEAALISGLPYVMDAYREEAEKIIDS